MFSGYNKVRLGMAVLLYFCSAVMAEAKVKLPALISDGMVLQREQPVKIWGKADAGESVRVNFGKTALPLSVKGKKLKDTYTAITNTDGQWSIELPPPESRRPLHLAYQ